MASKKNTRIDEETKNTLVDVLGAEQAAESEKVALPTTKTRKKPGSDYLKVDLRPEGGKDYKAYVTTMAGKLSAAEGKAISLTIYIQRLIDQDMQRNSGKMSKREKVIDQLSKLTDKQIDGLFALLSDM